MADYYPLLARAVAALPNSSRETRGAIYDRARKALLGQLRSLDPPVSQEHLDGESKALDDAIARLEAELGQEAGTAPPRTEPPARPNPPPPPPPPSTPAPSAPPRPASTAPVPPRPAPGSPPPLRPAPPTLRTPPAPPSRPTPPMSPGAPSGSAPSAPPRPSPGAPVEPFAPQNRGQGRTAFLEDEAAAPAKRDDMDSTGDEPPAVAARAPTGSPRSDAARPVAPTRPEQGRRVSRQMLIWAPLVLLIGGGIGFAAWRLRVPQEEFARPRATQAETVQPQGSAKINERAGGAGSTASPVQQAQGPQLSQPPRQSGQAPAQQTPGQQPAQQPQRPAADQGAPVAQRAAILVQAAVNDQQNIETHVGTTVWRLEESRRPGANGSPAVRADVDIPAVGMRMVFLIEKNNDSTLRASHMLTVRFLPQEGATTLPAVAEMGSPQMRNESSPGVEPLAGAQAKITEQIYIVALNSDPTLAARNLETMKSRGWFDFPIRFADGRIAKITIEKGAPGERLFNQALEQWQR